MAFSRVLAVAWLWPQTEAHPAVDEPQQAPDRSLGESLAGQRQYGAVSKAGLRVYPNAVLRFASTAFGVGAPRDAEPGRLRIRAKHVSYLACREARQAAKAGVRRICSSNDAGEC